MGEEFQIEARAPVLLAQIEEATALCRTGIVHQHVETAECARQRFDQRGRRIRRREIRGMDRRLAATRADFRCNALERFAVARGEHHVAAGRRQLDRDAAADAAARAGDQRDLAGQLILVTRLHLQSILIWANFATSTHLRYWAAMKAANCAGVLGFVSLPTLAMSCSISAVCRPSAIAA